MWSVSVRGAPPKPITRMRRYYSSEVGDHPAVGQRQTWLVMRLNAAESARAIVWRESVAATMSAAAEWLAQELTSLRIPARVLTAAQIRAADEALLAGVGSGRAAAGVGRGCATPAGMCTPIGCRRATFPATPSTGCGRPTPRPRW